MRPIVKLWEICEIWPKKSEISLDENTKVSFVPMSDLSQEEMLFQTKQENTISELRKWSYTYFKNNDVLLAKVTPCFENWKCWIARNLTNWIWFWSSEFMVFRPRNFILSEFLYYFISSKTFREEWEKNMGWAVWLQRVKKDWIVNHIIPLPPLETQKAIVAKLDQIFAELDQTKSEIQKNLDNTDELWKSALNQAFQGDWEMKTLQDVCLQKITDWTHQTPTYCGEKEWIPFISSKDVTKEYIDREWWIKYIPQSLHEELYARIAPQKDDVLLAKNWTTWVAAIVEDDRIFDIYVTLAVLRSNQQIITPRFLHRIVNSPICKRQFDKSLKWAGVPNLHLENIKTVTIPVPPLSEQEKIVEYLDQVSKEVKSLKSQYQSQLDNLEELKKSVLDNAFRWELGE